LRERRLAGAVVAEDGGDLAPVQLERDVVQRPHVPVDLPDAARADDHLAAWRVGNAAVGCTRQARPSRARLRMANAVCRTRHPLAHGGSVVKALGQACSSRSLRRADRWCAACVPSSVSTRYCGSSGVAFATSPPTAVSSVSLRTTVPCARLPWELQETRCRQR